MPKVIQFKTKKDEVIALLNNMEKFLNENNFTPNSAICVVKVLNKDGETEIVIGKSNCGVVTMLELNGHIQMQAMKDMIEENYVN